ncbi:MAG: hypothetical protein SGPRY_006904 [Prymnesium sp.]
MPRPSLAEQIGLLRGTPPFLADATDQALCARRPPFGLKDGLSRVKAISALSEKRNENRTRPHNQSAASICLGLAMGLRRATLGSSFLPRSRLRSCAVVGSSGGLLHSRHGIQVDSHDFILRFNTAPVTSYAGDVGNRTNLWVASHHPWRVKLRDASSQKKRGRVSDAYVALYCFNAWLGSCHGDAITGSYGKALLINPVLVSHVMALQQAHLGSSAKSIKPSTGLMGIAIALTLCTNVTLFGFANDSNMVAASNCNHYYDIRTGTVEL